MSAAADPRLWLHALLALALAPLLPGIVNRTKAFFAGRRGAPVWQAYADLARLLRKGAVYSTTTTHVIHVGPIVGLAAGVVALLLLPLGALPAPLRFPGDLLLFAGLLGVARIALVLGALDTGSAFAGMGASREAQFGALAEPALLLALAACAVAGESLSLSGILPALGPAWSVHGPSLALAAGALAIVHLVENARLPIDDPNTHLELTMVHEAMVLDHAGPDFAFLQYAAALRLWVVGTPLVAIVVPAADGPLALDLAARLAGLVGLAVAVGVLESSVARLRLLRVPLLIAAAGALGGLALLLVLA